MMVTAKHRLVLAEALWGWSPHATQREWLIDESRTKVAACGRRWGKTESAAIDAATLAIARPGSTQMIVSPTYDQSRLISDSVERFLLSSPVTRPQTKVVKTPYPRITILNSTIMARTADDDGRNLRGHSADRVIVDEAAYVRDSVIHEVIAPMLADRSGQLVMVSTPFGKNHFYRAFIRGQVLRQAQDEGVGGQVSSFRFPSWSNPHINAEYIESQREEISPRQFAVEYEAQFLDDQASVFAWGDIDAAARPLAPDSRPPAPDAVVAGIDWARYSDFTAVVALGVSESGLQVIAIERFNKMAWNQQMDRVTEFLRHYRVSTALTDKTSIGDPLLEQLTSRLCEAGVEASVEGFIFTNQSKRELIENLALQFSQGRIAIPRDEQLLRELQFYEYELTGSGNVRLNARSGYHDDLVIALALACRQAKAVGTGGRYLGGSGRITAAGW